MSVITLKALEKAIAELANSEGWVETSGNENSKKEKPLLEI
ncbi:MAG: hypothetical protein ACI8P3_002922 [Saprospiraceae bacterium]|jgi:hypothetical protein